MKRVRTLSALAIVATFGLAPIGAQQVAPAPTAPNDQHEHGSSAPQPGGGMDHAKMMADMKAADTRLQQLKQTMQSAKGDERIRAMQDLLSQLVQDQTMMHAQMIMMHEHMMAQMQMPHGQPAAQAPTPTPPAAHQH
jgi:hypothetical protein